MSEKELVNCMECEYGHSYCFDEYDSDAWCDKEKEEFEVLGLTKCEDYKPKTKPTEKPSDNKKIKQPIEKTCTKNEKRINIEQTDFKDKFGFIVDYRATVGALKKALKDIDDDLPIGVLYDTEFASCDIHEIIKKKKGIVWLVGD